MRRFVLLAAGCVVVLVGLAAASVPTAQTASWAGTACVARWRVIAEGKGVPDLYDVSALSATDVWAVGSRGGLHPSSTPLALHWDGHKLQFMRPFTPSSGRGQLSAVVAVANDDVWAVGIDGWGLGRLVAVHWDGRRWTVVPTPRLPGHGALSGIVAFSADDVWAVGQSGTVDEPEQPLVMRWNGHQWRVVDLRAVAPEASALYAIGGTSARDVWAVGAQNLDAHFFNYSALILRWDGRAWTNLASALGSPGSAVDARSPNDIWTVHGSSETGSGVVHWKDPGRASVAYDSPRFDLNDIAAVSQRSVWAVGYRSYSPARPLVVHWNGKSWQAQRAALDHKSVLLTSLSAISDTNIWAVGGGPTSGSGTLGDGLLAHYSCASQLLRRPSS